MNLEVGFIEKICIIAKFVIFLIGGFYTFYLDKHLKREKLKNNGGVRIISQKMLMGRWSKIPISVYRVKVIPI